MPSVSFDAKTSRATVAWSDQKDTMSFEHATNGKTSVNIVRDGKLVVDSSSPL